MTLEPDLPSDGRDDKGEAMIRDLPQRPELSEPPSQIPLATNPESAPWPPIPTCLHPSR